MEIAMSKAIEPALVRETQGHYPTGLAVVTAVAEDGRPAGMVVGTFSSENSTSTEVVRDGDRHKQQHNEEGDANGERQHD